MEVYASLDPALPLGDVAETARRIEGIGFDGIHVPETIHDSLVVALMALEHTSRVTVRTAVTLAFVRSPTLVAYTAWDLATLSGGRFELGLGTQIRQNVEGRYGMTWSEPVARMRDYVGALRALFASFQTGAPLQHEGSVYRLTRMQPYFNPGPTEHGPPKVFLGAVNPRMCALAGEVADGVVTHPTNSHPDYLAEVVRPALGADGRLIAAATVATGADDAAVAVERERQRRLLAFLYSTPAYRPTLERHGWPDLQEQLASLVRADRWGDLPDVLTDDFLDVVLTCGRYDELPGLLRARFGEVADGVVFSPPADRSGDAALAEAVAALRGS